MAFPASEFEVLFFEDGAETMKALSQLRPDAVLVNLSLPQKDGYKVAYFLKNREEFKQTSLFLLRGAFEPLDAEKMRGLEYDKIVEEPFDSERLARIVRDSIEGKKDPLTLPEEPLVGDAHAAQEDIELKHKRSDIEACSVDSSQRAVEHSPVISEEFEAGTEEKLRNLVKQESLEVGRELERRLKTQVFTDIKEWLDQELDRIRKLLKRE